MANDKKFIVKNGLLTPNNAIIGSTTDTGERLQVTGDSLFTGDITLTNSQAGDLFIGHQSSGTFQIGVDPTNSKGFSALSIYLDGSQFFYLSTTSNLTIAEKPFYYRNDAGTNFAIIEGSTNDSFETTLAVVDPTASNVITFPDVSGTIFTTGNMGSGSGLDADLLDALDSTQFVRSDQSDTMDGDYIITGNLTVSGTTVYANTVNMLVSDNIFTLNADYVSGTPSQDAGFEIRRGDEANSSLIWDETNDWFKLISAGTDLGRIITTADEGAGNGFDADSVDGLHAGQFLRADADDTANGTITFENDIIVGDNTGGAQITFDGSNQNRILYSDNGEIGFLNAGLNYAAKSDGNNNWIVTANTVAKSFVDADDNSYYVNPADTSIINNLRINNVIYHNGDIDTNFGFTATDEFKVFTGGTERLSIDNTNATFSYNVEADRFVDKDATGYYAEPGGESVFHALGIDDDLFHNGDTDTKLSFSTDTISFNTGGSTRFTLNNTAATFNVPVYIDDYIYHNGDTNSYLGWSANDNFSIYSNGIEAININDDGHVGVGTNSHIYQFEVNTGTSDYIRLTSTDQRIGIILDQGGSFATGYMLADDDMLSLGSLSTKATSNLNISLASATRGNVGIGDNAPTARLSVRTTSGMGNNPFTDANRLINFGEAAQVDFSIRGSAQQHAYFISDQDKDWYFYDSGASGKFAIQNSGNVIVNNDSVTYSAHDNSTFVFGTVNDNRLHVDGSVIVNGANDGFVVGTGTSTVLKQDELAFGSGAGIYMDNSTYLKVSNSVKFQANNDIEATRFVDKDNTAYFANPAGTSVFNDLGIDDDLFHNGDTDTKISFATDAITFSTGGTQRFGLDNDSADFAVNVYAPRYYDSDDNTYYGDFAGTSITNTMRAQKFEVDSATYTIDGVTGDYGSIKVAGNTNGYAGYAINDDWVFMSNGASAAGIYNDTDNEWAIYFARNAGTDLYYNGVVEGETESGYLKATNQMRSPVYYDVNNTTYFLDLDAGNTSSALYVPGKIQRGNFASGDVTTNIFLDAQDANHWIWTPATNWGIFWATSTSSNAYYGGTNPNEITFLGNGNIRAAIDLDNGNAYFQGTVSAGSLAINGGNEDLSLLKQYGTGYGDQMVFDGSEYWDKRVTNVMQGSEDSPTTVTAEYVKVGDGPFTSSYAIETTAYRTFYSDYILVEPGEEIYGEMSVKYVSGSGGQFYFGIERFDKDKNPIATNAGTTYFVASGANVTSTSWTTFSGYTTIPTSHTVYNGSDGLGVKYIRIRILMNYAQGGALRQFGPPILRRSNYQGRLRGDDIIVTGDISSSTRVDAPIFYDSDDTTYYGNFAGNSRFSGSLSLGTGADASGSKLHVRGGAILNEAGGANTYGQFKGYNNNNHFITSRGIVTGTPTSPTITGGHQTTFVEHLNPADDTTGFFFKNSYPTGDAYETIAAIRKNNAYFPRGILSTIFTDSDNTTYYVNPSSTGEAMRLAGRIRLDNNGQEAWMDMLGDAANEGRMRFMNYNGDVGIEFSDLTNGDGTGDSSFMFGMDDKSTGNMFIRFNNSSLFPNDFTANGTELWTLMYNGRMGILETDPDYQLHITGTGYATNDFRSPLFYDFNNTSYYGNFAGTSVMRDILFTGTDQAAVFNGTNPYIRWRENGTDRAYIQWLEASNALLFRNQEADDFIFRPDGDSAVRLRLQGADGDDWGSVYAANSEDIGFLDDQGSWAIRHNRDSYTYFYINGSLRSYITSSQLVHVSSMRAPIYYDYFSSFYYLQPRSFSRLYTVAALDAFRSDRFEEYGGAFLFREGTNTGRGRHLNLWDSTSDPSQADGGVTGISWGRRTDNNPYYMIYTDKQNFNGNYSKLHLDWHTGIRMGAYNGYGGIRFYNNSSFIGTEIGSIGKNTNNIRAEYAMESPIYYDTAASNRYMDPASTSVINNLIINGYINFVEPQGEEEFRNPEVGWWQEIPLNYGSSNYGDVFVRLGQVTGDYKTTVIEYYMQTLWGGFFGIVSGEIVVTRDNGNIISISHLPGAHMRATGNSWQSYSPGVYLDDNNHLWISYQQQSDLNGKLYFRYKFNDGGMIRDHYFGAPFQNSAITLTNGTLVSHAGPIDMGIHWTLGVGAASTNYSGGPFNWGFASNISGNNFYGYYFRDKDNTGRYVEPGGTSRLGRIESFDTQIFKGGNQLQFETSGGNIRGYIQATDTNDEHFKIATSGGEDIRFLDGGLSGDWNVIMRGDGQTLFRSSISTPIMYDRNDTNFYVDPAGSSVINNLDVQGTFILPSLKMLYGQDYVVSDPTSNGNNAAGRAQKVSEGLAIYTGYNTGSNRPHTYDITAQFNLSGRAFEISADWVSATGTPLKVRSLRDCCQGWSPWVDIATSTRSFTNTVDLRAPIFYDSNDTNFYMNPAGNSNISTMDFDRLDGPSTSSFDKIRVYDSDSYAIGMVSGRNYGSLGDWAMTFRFNDDTNRGFWWGHTGHTADEGAMSLTTDGRLTVANNVRVGYGEGDTSEPSYDLDIDGTGYASGDFRSRVFYDTDDTNYYANPKGDSVFHGLILDSGTTQLRFGSGAASGNWYMGRSDNDDFYMRSGDSDHGRLNFEDSGGTDCAELYWDDDGSVFAMRHDNGENIIYSDENDNTYIYYNNDWQGITYNGYWRTRQTRSGIFYDYDNTGYYANPNNVTRLYKMQSQAIYDWNERRYLIPEGGTYTSTSSAVTGTLKIQLPADRRGRNTMVQMRIVVYEYNDGRFHEFRVGGYNYRGTDNYWTRVSATQFSDSDRGPFTIRFCDDGSEAAICIGNTDYTWVYPQVHVMEIQSGYSGHSTEWGRDVDISITTSYPTVRTSRVASMAMTTNNASNFSANVYGLRYYSQDSTGYYADPSSTSVFNALQLNSGTTQLRFGSNWYMGRSDDDDFYIRSGDSDHGRLNFEDSGGTDCAELYWDDDGSVFAMRHDNGENIIYSDENDNTYIYYNNIWQGLTYDGYWRTRQTRSTIFYDYDDTNYYANPAGTSRLGTIQCDDVQSAGNVTAYTTFSDIRWKENVKVIENAVEKVQQLDGITFNYIDEEEELTGVIAQQVEKVLPGVVYEVKDKLSGEDRKAVRYGNMVGLLIEATKEQQKTIEKQKEEIDTLKEMVYNLMEKLDK